MLICLCLVASASLIHADMQQLKREVASLQRSVDDAQKGKDSADNALRANLQAQRNASGDALARLKREAVALSARAHEAGETLRTARSNLASKHGELRTEASKQATRQVNADGDLDKRVADARAALAEWRSAIGDIPNAPQPRDLREIDDELKAAFRKTDIDRLRAFEAWAKAEDNRVEQEIKSADKLMAWNVKDAADGARLTSEARALKASLEARRKAVQAAAQSAEGARKRLERED